MSKGELHLALARLSELDRAIVQMYYGFTASPSSDRLIGEHYAMNDQAVQRRRQLALTQLRTILEGADDGR